jgi:hypothetical protein
MRIINARQPIEVAKNPSEHHGQAECDHPELQVERVRPFQLHVLIARQVDGYDEDRIGDVGRDEHGHSPA